MSDTKKMLTTHDVAEWLGYSPDQVRSMCESGKFDGDFENGEMGAFRDGSGSHWRIPRTAVLRWLSSTRPRVRRQIVA